MHRVNDGPLAYRYLVAMPGDPVVMELPFGDHAWDLRYVYYAGLHGKRIVNGYSGYFPDGYLRRAAKLSGLWADRDAATEALVTTGATHLLVHTPPTTTRRARRDRLGATGRRHAGGVLRRRGRAARAAAELTIGLRRLGCGSG